MLVWFHYLLLDLFDRTALSGAGDESIWEFRERRHCTSTSILKSELWDELLCSELQGSVRSGLCTTWRWPLTKIVRILDAGINFGDDCLKWSFACICTFVLCSSTLRSQCMRQSWSFQTWQLKRTNVWICWWSAIWLIASGWPRYSWLGTQINRVQPLVDGLALCAIHLGGQDSDYFLPSL